LFPGNNCLFERNVVIKRMKSNYGMTVNGNETRAQSQMRLKTSLENHRSAGLSSLSSRRSIIFRFQKYLGHDYKRKRGELETCSQEREPVHAKRSAGE
jgi:hypothetical protein